MRNLQVVLLCSIMSFSLVFVDTQASNLRGKIAEINNGTVNYTVPIADIENYLKSQLGSNATLLDYEIQLGDPLYLIGSGDADGTSISVATELTQSGDDVLIPTAATTHTCTGDPCSCCGFKYVGGAIVGCICNPFTGCTGNKCNHTITTGSAAVKSSADRNEEQIASDAFLFQNVPNPFGAATAIRYHIPANAGSAAIVIVASDGRTIQRFEINDSGYGTIEFTDELAAGVYVYSLIVDGRTVQTRNMMISR